MATAAGVLLLCLGIVVASSAEASVPHDHHMLIPELHGNVLIDTKPHKRVVPAGRGGVKWQGRVLYGQEAAECQFPHQVALRTETGAFCGGSLIDPRWVLTAAHCVSTAYRVTVWAGSAEWAKAPQSHRVGRIFLHGDFNAGTLNYDVALLRLEQPFTLGECVRPVTLESNGCGNEELDGATVVVSGWGHTRDGAMDVESRLRWTRARAVANAECIEAFNEEVVLRTTLCTRPLPTDANGTLCYGDSGGALLLESSGAQIGVNSFVSDLGCESGLPCGYARVPCFVDWIRYVMTL